MRPNGNQSVRSVFIAFAILGCAIPTVQANDFTTAEGRSVILPEIDDMTCDQMNMTLTAIDLTRYRENAPTPHNDADKPLFVYEEKLAHVHFHSCIKGKQKAEGGNDLRKTPEKK